VSWILASLCVITLLSLVASGHAMIESREAMQKIRRLEAVLYQRQRRSGVIVEHGDEKGEEVRGL